MDFYEPIMKSSMTIEDRRRQGVVHFNIYDYTSDPRVMSDEESDAHIVGVIFSHHFILNIGLKLFGDKANVVV